MAGETAAFREVLPKSGLLYTQEAPELVSTHKNTEPRIYDRDSCNFVVSWGTECCSIGVIKRVVSRLKGGVLRTFSILWLVVSPDYCQWCVHWEWQFMCKFNIIVNELHHCCASSDCVQAQTHAPQVCDIREVGKNAERCKLSCPTTISDLSCGST